MTSNRTAQPPGLTPVDFVIIAFKHKWKVLICTIIGFAAAAAYYFVTPTLYQSEAKLLVRYVVDSSAIDSVGGAGGEAPRGPNDSILNSEVEILGSWDSLEQVAQEIGPERLYPGVKDAKSMSGANAIAAGLTVEAVPNTNVIRVSFKSPDPDLAPLVLEDLLEAYFSRHLDIHRSKAAFDMVSQQTDIIRGELLKTEEDLKSKKAAANILSVQDTTSSLNYQLADTQREINSATTALAEQRALVGEMEKAYGSSGGGQAKASGNTGTAKQGAAQSTNAPATSGTNPASPQEIDEYQEDIGEVTALHKKAFDLLTVYSRESIPYKMNEERIAEVEKQVQDLASKHPDLLGHMPIGASSSSGHGIDLTSERARLVSLEAGMQTLQDRLKNIQEQEKEFAKVAPDIEGLERTEALQQAAYATSQSKLQNATVDEALDPSKIPNISTVQKPSPPMKVKGNREKTVVGLAGGGLALGIALAFAIEMFLDQSIKRPMELEHRLGVPLSVAIPFITGRNNRRLPAPAGEMAVALATNGNGGIAPWEPTHFVRPYAETIRDRLGLYFEANQMTHRPKLLAITGSAEGSGTSTLAAGIAAALSELGEGKVLLVDMNMERTEAHPFFRGRPACSLTTALSQGGKEMTSAAENLYLATTASNGNGNSRQFGLKRLREIIPNIKESDFDYVVFDMPPLSQTSPTAAMAAYMDQVIFVVESEKGQRDAVKRDYAQLTARKPDVLVVMNKVRSYVPKWIDKGT
jgi:polysaccharide biosynthesis transport protein